MTKTERQLEQIAEELETLRIEIAEADDDATEARATRAEVWKLAEEAGVKRAQLARWSACDPMLVTRSLRED
jgi:chromosome segregation ATPase